MRILGFDEEGMELMRKRAKIIIYVIFGLWIFLSLLFWIIGLNT